jgi:hypothetical protein
MIGLYAFLLFSLTNGDTFWIDPPVSPGSQAFVNNIGQGNFVGSRTNAGYWLQPGGTAFLYHNNAIVTPLLYRGQPFAIDFFTFGFCLYNGAGWYLGRHGDSNQNCLWSINLEDGTMNFFGCIDFGNIGATANGLTPWDGLGLPIWLGVQDQEAAVLKK